MALRQAQEPLDLFRRYMSNYARQQAHCLYSPALIDNLERNWKREGGERMTRSCTRGPQLAPRAPGSARWAGISST